MLKVDNFDTDVNSESGHSLWTTEGVISLSIARCSAMLVIYTIYLTWLGFFSPVISMSLLESDVSVFFNGS